MPMHLCTPSGATLSSLSAWHAQESCFMICQVMADHQALSGWQGTEPESCPLGLCFKMELLLWAVGQFDMNKATWVL